MNEPLDSPESESVGRARLQESRGSKLQLAITGGALAVLSRLVYAELLPGVVPYIGRWQTMMFAAILGAWAGVGRGRKVVWWFAIVAVALVLFIGFTPFVPTGIRRLVQADPLEKAPAVVILAAGVDKRGVMNSNARTRLDRGLELVGQGYAPRMVLTEASTHTASWAPIVRRHVRDIGLDFPIDSVGPVVNTHDEAVVVSRLAKERGWSH